ncbi:MAG TPA: LamG-like jellyroll fold domain-containing protein [Steroidobacteraceae bacterium]|nr:LamG-like jellyroll fold domain-containing protein [Steroidobacteraceae bacterium]
MANPFQVGAGGASGAASSPGGSAIYGDNQTPYACAILPSSGSSLTTGDLETGSAGEMGNLAGFAIEFWFMLVGTFPGAFTVVQGPLSSSGASRQYTMGLTAGNAFTASVLDDAAGAHTITGATTLASSLFYHVVLTANSGTLSLYINGVSDASDGTWGSHTVRPLGTTAGSLDFSLIQNFSGADTRWDEVATYRTGLSSTRVFEHYNAGVNHGRKAEATGARIGALLDAISSHAPRSIQAGARSVVPRYFSGQSPLEEMRLALEADDVDAQLWCSKSGVVVFLQDGHRSSAPYNTVQAVFGNAGGSELPYLDLQVSYDVGQVINEWNVTRTGYNVNTPATQTASDATSQARYFKRSQSLGDVPCTNDSDASTIATALLAKYKDPFYMVTSLKPNMADQQTAETVYTLDLCDRVEVKWTPPGGGSRIDQTVFIQKIEHSGNPNGPPDCTLTVTPF